MKSNNINSKVSSDSIKSGLTSTQGQGRSWAQCRLQQRRGGRAAIPQWGPLAPMSAEIKAFEVAKVLNISRNNNLTEKPLLIILSYLK